MGHKLYLRWVVGAMHTSKMWLAVCPANGYLFAHHRSFYTRGLHRRRPYLVVMGGLFGSDKLPQHVEELDRRGDMWHADLGVHSCSTDLIVII